MADFHKSYKDKAKKMYGKKKKGTGHMGTKSTNPYRALRGK